jgi:hypothetical protein
MKPRYLALGVAVIALAAAQPIGAATATSNLTVSASVAATAQLTLGSTKISFADANPDTVPSIAATEGAMTVSAKGKTSTSGAVTLTLLAAGNLTSGSDTIPITNVTWTVTGTGFAAGTMNRTTAQSAGSWTGSGAHAGTMTFALANSWAYATGSYATTATFTLTAP